MSNPEQEWSPPPPEPSYFSHGFRKKSGSSFAGAMSILALLIAGIVIAWQHVQIQHLQDDISSIRGRVARANVESQIPTNGRRTVDMAVNEAPGAPDQIPVAEQPSIIGNWVGQVDVADWEYVKGDDGFGTKKRQFKQRAEFMVSFFQNGSVVIQTSLDPAVKELQFELPDERTARIFIPGEPRYNEEFEFDAKLISQDALLIKGFDKRPVGSVSHGTMSDRLPPAWAQIKENLFRRAPAPGQD